MYRYKVIMGLEEVIEHFITNNFKSNDNTVSHLNALTGNYEQSSCYTCDLAHRPTQCF